MVYLYPFFLWTVTLRAHSGGHPQGHLLRSLLRYAQCQRRSLLRYAQCQRRSPASCRFHWRGFNWHVELFLHLKLLNPAAQSHIPEGLDARLIRCFDVLQTVYRHCSFGRQSVIVIFYKLCTATVRSVGSLSCTARLLHQNPTAPTI